MGFLDGISNSLKKIKETEQTGNDKTQNNSQAEQNPDEIDVFGQDLNEDGIGDNIQLNSENLQEDEDGNSYVKVDNTHNNSLYKIM